ncbi:MAG: acyltransferase [Bacteroidales bacterium]|nr:acyltransferase [Bacteroidales bacterium]
MINNEETFRAAALEVFHYQSKHSPVYRDYLAALKINPYQIIKAEDIPFLPIEFFKSHTVLAEGKDAEVIFESSGTSGVSPSRHHVADTGLYRESFLRSFNASYGSPEELCILALLPSYLERESSSLVYMMNQLIRWSKHSDSGFYLDQMKELSAILQKRNNDHHPTLLLGVSFALLDLAEKHPMSLERNITVMETGGMKGRRKEMVRGELHEALMHAFNLDAVHSEYGMTELLSQAYSRGQGLFHPPPWMKILIRDPNDPFSLLPAGQSGGINIIDPANLYSCSFIATGDLGKTHEDGSFEVLGRFDHSDIRGCNLLVP